jgi:hypothetical protein
MATAKPIIWTTGKYGSQQGRVGGEVLFGLHTSTKRGDTSLLLRTDLPGYNLNYTMEGEDSAKEFAAKILDTFVKKVTE